jgi:hypothetical protein
MLNRAIPLALLALLLFFGWGRHEALPQTPSPARTLSLPGARVYFKDLADNAAVPSQFTVHFGAEKIEIVSTDVVKPNAGHHHLLIDAPMPALDEPIPSDANHLHFGRGQTEGDVVLSAGEHTLQLLLGDSKHIPHNPPVASPVLHVHVDPASVAEARTPAANDARVFFIGLEDGAKIPTQSVVKFGVSAIELAPAGVKKPNAGHHHLIIDAPTPDLDREIPSDPNHLHFGRGETEALLTLAPGPHTLQLLLGDHDHVPHDPPVMSEAIHVTAVDSDAAGPLASASSRRAPAPPDAAVYFVYPSNRETIYPTSTIRFGLKNMGVAPAGIDKVNTGHHHLLIDVEAPRLDEAIPSDPQHLHFGGGQTEKKITLSPGRHTLQLILGDYQHVPHDPPVISERIEVFVMNFRKKRKSR